MKKKIINKINKVEGLINLTEIKCLYDFATKIQKGIIVEIGAYKGKSTIALACGYSGNKKIISIDPHENGIEHTNKKSSFIDFQKNIKKFRVKNKIKIIKNYSEKIYTKIPNGIELLFIDGNHHYKNVKNDILLYQEKLIEKGYIIFHDAIYDHPGVRKAIKKYIYQSKKYKTIGIYSGIMVFQKVKKLKFIDYINNYLKSIISKIKNYLYIFGNIFHEISYKI